MEKKYCPVPAAGWDCPYCGKDNKCQLDNPALECDDYYAWGGDDSDDTAD